MLRPRCSKCGRAGLCQIDRLIKQYGLDIALPDLGTSCAQCPHLRDIGDPLSIPGWIILDREREIAATINRTRPRKPL